LQAGLRNKDDRMPETIDVDVPFTTPERPATAIFRKDAAGGAR